MPLEISRTKVYKEETGEAAHVTRSPWQKGRPGSGQDPKRRGARDVVSQDSLARRWGVILAGGDGTRLRPLTRFICGDDRPKQFCPLLRESSLLEEARQRAERSVYSNQILYPVTRAHQDYYNRDLADRASQRIVQPSNKGTAPAILSALLCISNMDPEAIVAMLPCDHYYSDEAAFTTALETAFAVAEELSGSILLLGAQPNAPEVEYGWIELGQAVVDPCHGSRPVFQVKGFQEKPVLPVAQRLLRGGHLWNTFVMVGHVRAFLDLALESVAGLLHTLRSACVNWSCNAETKIGDWVYDQIAQTDFSRQVLSTGARRLITMSLGESDWNDLGDPGRVLSTLRASNLASPAWVTRWHHWKRSELGRHQRVSVAVA